MTDIDVEITDGYNIDVSLDVGGATKLNELSDVTLTSPQNSDHLIYNSTSGVWENTSASPTTPAGSDGQIQFNDSGAFGASSDLFWNDTQFWVRTDSANYSRLNKDGTISLARNTFGDSNMSIDPSSGNNLSQISTSHANGLAIGGSSFSQDINIDTDGNVGFNETSPDTLGTFSQYEDSNGIKINGFDDRSGDNLNMYIDSNGWGTINSDITNFTGTQTRFSSGETLFSSTNNKFFDNRNLLFGDSGDTSFKFDTTDVVATFKMGLSSSSNIFLIGGGSYMNDDFDHAAQTDPTIFIHSATDPDTDNTQWLSLTHDKTDAVFGVGTGKIVLDAATQVTGDYYQGSGSDGWKQFRTLHGATVNCYDRFDVSGTTVLERFYDTFKDQYVISINEELGRQFILATGNNWSKDFDHATPTDVTLFIQSATDPNVDNTQWLSLSHDKTDAIFNIGTGDFVFNGSANFTGEIRQGPTDYGSYEIQTSGEIYANNYIVANGGMMVGPAEDPGTGSLLVSRYITQKERNADPSDPSEGSYTLWMSDGTGSGDDGDVMMKITAGGTTKTVTLVDFSAA